MDTDGLTACCATAAETRVAERAGLRAARVGLRATNGVPDGELVSFGLAGALDGLSVGTVLDATRVVDEAGNVLWEGAPLGIPGGRPATLVAAAAVVADPAERSALRARTGADAVDLESGALARSGRLRGAVRAVSDNADSDVATVAAAVRDDGSYDWFGIARAFASSPRAFVRAAGNGRRALRALATAAERWRAA